MNGAESLVLLCWNLHGLPWSWHWGRRCNSVARWVRATRPQPDLLLFSEVWLRAHWSVLREALRPEFHPVSTIGDFGLGPRGGLAAFFAVPVPGRSKRNPSSHCVPRLLGGVFGKAMAWHAKEFTRWSCAARPAALSFSTRISRHSTDDARMLEYVPRSGRNWPTVLGPAPEVQLQCVLPEISTPHRTSTSWCTNWSIGSISRSRYETQVPARVRQCTNPTSGSTTSCSGAPRRKQ
ncbi:hypothetical protein HRbin30_02962 [bacterium HR30]|nr:hypothetical protein HRbin30_02962 [bacterium HR30]